MESWLNTLLFAGFPGFVSKLWFAADESGVYRGIYDWDGPAQADAYVRALWWPLALVSDLDSIRYQVLPGLRRDEVIADPPQVARWLTLTGASPRAGVPHRQGPR